MCYGTLTSTFAIRSKMSRLGTLLVVVLAVAFATNPDDASFRRYVEDGMER